MQPDGPAVRASAGIARLEWPTWLLLVAVYGSWLLLVSHAPTLGPLLGSALLALVACWFMSVQHELLHGHPTRRPALNRLLGLAPLAVWYPYDLYRAGHLAHHRDELLTQPGIDPESNYITSADYARLPRALRPLWFAQRTVLGRVLLGPAMVIVPTWLDIVRKPLRGDFSQTRSWAQHLLLLGTLLWALDRYAGIGPLQYLLAVGYPALGLAMLRSFYEHRPATQPAHRVVINEAGWFWRLLYLNNNYHAVHHESPGLPWYRIAERWRTDRAGVLRRNGGFLVGGYGTLLRQHALRPVDSPVHPADGAGVAPAGASMSVAGPTAGRCAGWPMYVADRPAVRAWWRGLAGGLRERGVDGVPDALDEPDDAAALEAHWLDPRLLLSQTCGYPLVTRLAGRVQVVGALRWTAPGCDGIHYRSWLVARGDGAASAGRSETDGALAADAARAIEPFRGRVAAVNDAASHSGCNALRALVAPLSRGSGRRFFARSVETGSHRASLAAVRDGRADIAAIDCITWAGLRRTAPALLDGLRIVAGSAPAPGLPLITAAATAPAELAALRNTLVAACADQALADTRAALFIGGFEVAEASQWDVVDAMRRSALAVS